MSPTATPTAPRPSAVIACALPDEVLRLFSDAFDIVVVSNPERPDPAEVVALAAGRDLVAFSVPLAMNRELVERLPASVRAVGTYSVGFDHVDLDACRARGLAVFNTPDVLTDAVAEVGLLLLLGAARRAREATALVLEGKWRGWQPTQLNGVELAGKTLGVFGMGRIGRAIAERARAFGMAIHYSNRSRLAPQLENGATFHADVASLLGVSDALVLACPATPETVGFLDARRIGELKPGAIVVNVARGVVIDDDALIPALASGRVRAAGLDVFRGEPNLDPRYLGLPNAFLLPHIGSSTIETRLRMGQILVDGFAAALAGQPAANRIA